MPRSFRAWFAALALATSTACALAQGMPPLQNVLQLSATGSVDTPQDLLVVTLTTTRDGSDAAAVQAQLKTALEAALAEAKKSALPGQLDVRTGHFGLFPRYQRDGRITGWAGTAEVVLEGRDFARIAQVAGKVPGLTVGSVQFGLSREQRAKVEGDAQTQAIERFKARAQELAKGFGFTGYTLREVTVNANEGGPMPRYRELAAAPPGAAAAAAPIPVEAGKTTVTVNVSGSVQLK